MIILFSLFFLSFQSFSSQIQFSRFSLIAFYRVKGDKGKTIIKVFPLVWLIVIIGVRRQTLSVDPVARIVESVSQLTLLTQFRVEIDTFDTNLLCKCGVH